MEGGGERWVKVGSGKGKEREITPAGASAKTGLEGNRVEDREDTERGKRKRTKWEGKEREREEEGGRKQTGQNHEVRPMSASEVGLAWVFWGRPAGGGLVSIRSLTTNYCRVQTQIPFEKKSPTEGNCESMIGLSEYRAGVDSSVPYRITGAFR